MPIYEYKCSKCGHQFELIRPLKMEEEKINCPRCGDAYPEKLISVFSCSANKESSLNTASGCSSGSSRFT
ncbi:MAG: FmdB family zinc ribbon protein [Thermodesulfobacteriota bacterium]